MVPFNNNNNKEVVGGALEQHKGPQSLFAGGGCWRGCFLFLLFWGTPKDMDLRNAYVEFTTSLYCIAEHHKRVSMTTFGSRLSTCYRVLEKERLLTYGVDSPGQSRGISPLQVVAELVLSLLL